MEFSFDIPERTQAQNRSLRVKFFKKSKIDKVATEEAKKTTGMPVHVLVDYIEIHIPGDRAEVITRPVKDEDKTSFAPQWQAFLAEQDQDEVSGTPLSAVGFPQNRIDDLRYHKIYTVEQYAEVNDGNITKLGPIGQRERERCKELVAAAKSRAPVLELQSKLDAMSKRNATLEDQVRAFAARLSSLEGKTVSLPPNVPTEAAPAPKRRGRPKKIQEVTDVG